jgi:hypothetical protein
MRKIRYFVLFMVLMGAFGFSPPADQPVNFKPGSEPDGFRGIKWGAHISAVNDLVQAWENGDRKFYTRKSEDLEIGGAKLHQIIYVFWQERLMEVRVSILKNYDGSRDELVNFNIVKDICFEQFGERKAPLLAREQYAWNGEKTWVHLGRGDLDSLRLVVGSVELAHQKTAMDRKKIEQEEKHRKQIVREARAF